MRSRRGIASVVGMVFAIIALTTTITYISYSMGILNNYNQSVLVKNQQLTDVDKEKFQISSVTVPNGKLNITVTDTGSLPIQFTKVWIQNTSATDQVYSYVPTHNFVSAGGVLTNMGQSMTHVNPADSYNVKIVTSRGNTQQFNLNSITSTPLNIQLDAFPANIPSQTTTELVMIVTNNSTNTLVNVTPNTPTSNGSSTFTYPALGAASPPSYNTLAPGQTAIFKWDLTPAGNTKDARTFTASLQGGLPTNTASTKVTIIDLTAKSSDWSTTWGILSINFNSLQWSQNGGSTWNSAWSVPTGTNMMWRVNVTNNDLVRTFIFNGNSSLIAFSTAPGSNTAVPFYQVTSNMGIYSTNTLSLPPTQTTTIYLGAQNAGTNTAEKFSNSNGAKAAYAVSILVYGYWDSIQSNNFFGQNIPYEGIVVS